VKSSITSSADVTTSNKTAEIHNSEMNVKILLIRKNENYLFTREIITLKKMFKYVQSHNS